MPRAALALSWVASGHLLLLALEHLFPRFVFGLGPQAAWPSIAVLAAVVALTGPRELARAALDAMQGLSSVGVRRALALTTVVVASLCAWATHRWPAGVDVALVHPDGSRSQIGRRGSFDLDRAEITALSTHVATRVHMSGHFVPAWQLPWDTERQGVLTRWLIIGCGSLRLEINPHNVVVMDPASSPIDGLVKDAGLTHDPGPIELEFLPSAVSGDGRLRIELVDQRLPWRLLASPVSSREFWLISMARVLEAAWMIFFVPLALGMLARAAHGALHRRPEGLTAFRVAVEGTFVAAAAALFVLLLAPWIDHSASGDHAAFLNWADYLRNGGWMQGPPAWLTRWVGAPGALFVAMGHHVRVPPESQSMPQLVNMKPVGLPLIIALFQRVGGETAGYHVSSVLAALGAAALYGAARVTGIPVLLSAAAASGLLICEEVLVESSVLDPDAATMGWVSLFLFALLLSHRGKRWALLAGAFLGIACLTRYNAAVAFVAAVPLLLGRRNRILPFFVGGLPFLAALLFVNARAYGHPLHFPYLDVARENSRMAGPYWSSLLGYLRGISRDLSPAIWAPFLAYPLLASRPRDERVALTLIASVWVLVMGSFFKADAHFVRYMIPVYPALILGSAHVWHRLAERLGRLGWLSLAGFVLFQAAWTVPRMTTYEDLFPRDQARVAAAWVDHWVRPDGVVLTDTVFDNAVYYYTGRRHFSLSLPMTRSDADLRALRRAAHEAGDIGEWVLLVRDRDADRVRREYPELFTERIASGAEWHLERVAHVEGVD